MYPSFVFLVLFGILEGAFLVFVVARLGRESLTSQNLRLRITSQFISFGTWFGQCFS